MQCLLFLVKRPKHFPWKCSGLSVCPLESPKENELQEEQVGPSLMGIKRWPRSWQQTGLPPVRAHTVSCPFFNMLRGGKSDWHEAERMEGSWSDLSDNLPNGLAKANKVSNASTGSRKEGTCCSYCCICSTRKCWRFFSFFHWKYEPKYAIVSRHHHQHLHYAELIELGY